MEEGIFFHPSHEANIDLILKFIIEGRKITDEYHVGAKIPVKKLAI